MELVGPILGSVIQLAIVVGIVVLIVRRVSKRGRTTSEGAGLLIRRFFQYAVMLGTLALAGVGLAGLIDAAAAGVAGVAQDTAAVARSIAFFAVGVPVYVVLAIRTARHLKDDPREQQSLGWAFYLTIALPGSLLTTMLLVIPFLVALADEGEIDRALLVNAAIWAPIWAGHWRVAQRKGSARRMQIHLLVGSAAGLVAIASGVGAGLAAVLERIYDGLFVPASDTDLEALTRPLMILAVGVPVWWWYWLRSGRRSSPTPWWLAHVLLLGILGGVIAFVSGAGVVMNGVLQWVWGDPSSTSAAAHFRFTPRALGAVIAGGASWAYHRIVLSYGARRERSEVDRIYDYLLSGAGLLVAAAGLVMLVAVGLDAAGEGEIASAGNATAAAVTLLVTGLPLWWRYWSTARRHREADPQSELGSVTRRVYLFLLFGAIGIAAVVDVVVLIYLTVEDILEATFGSTTTSSAAVPIGLLLTAGAVAWYHFAVYRRDRAAVPDEERPALREVILLCTDGDRLAEAINARTGATVHPLHAVAGPIATGGFDEVLEALRTERHRRVVVVRTDDGFDVIPIED